MATYDLPLGSERIVDGIRYDRTQTVRVDGDRLASRAELLSADGSRGFTETLYYTSDRRLVVHVDNWSKLGGQMSTFSLVEITRADLSPGGRFEVLGRDAWAWLRA
jgi:hypothetical protein